MKMPRSEDRGTIAGQATIAGRRQRFRAKRLPVRVKETASKIGLGSPTAQPDETAAQNRPCNGATRSAAVSGRERFAGNVGEARVQALERYRLVSSTRVAVEANPAAMCFDRRETNLFEIMIVTAKQLHRLAAEIAMADVKRRRNLKSRNAACMSPNRYCVFRAIV
jgi:hypothetical protein